MVWLAGRHAFLTNNSTGYTEIYSIEFNAGYHANKDPQAGDIVYPVRIVPWTDPSD
jgi:hypothetical protein